MNLIDFFLFLIILLGVLSGFHKGLILGAIDLLVIFITVAFAIWASRYVAAFFEKYITDIGVWTLPLTFITSFIFANAILSALTARLTARLPQMVHGNIVNKSLGVIPGAINGIIYAAIVSALVLAMPLVDGLSAKTRESSIADALTPHLQWVEDKLAPVFEGAIGHSINHLTVNPTSKTSINLDFTVDKPAIRDDLESQMVEMINEERLKENLPPLAPDPEMREVARKHSLDMFSKGYFSHINKEGESPAGRARKAGVRFLIAGENLAFAQTLKLAHNGLMNSPGHRANILQKSYGRVGIAVLDGGRHGLMITQNFRN